MDSHRHDLLDRSREAVCRPAFVGAVVVLAVNDHLLKGAGLLPAAWTGKISDFAGLFFFPVLLAVATTYLRAPEDARTVRRYSLSAAALTVAAFSVLNLSPTVASALSEVWGVHTADPTDLIALPAAAAGHLWFMAELRRPEPAGFDRRWRVAVVLVAATASLATSKKEPVPDYKIENETDHSRSFVSSDVEALVESPDDELRRIPLEGGAAETVVSKKGTLWRQSVSPDGSVVALNIDGEPYLYRPSADEQPVPLPDFPGEVRDMAVSADGHRVAVEVRHPGPWWKQLSSPSWKGASLHIVDSSTLEAEKLEYWSGGEMFRLSFDRSGSHLYLYLEPRETWLSYDIDERRSQEIDLPRSGPPAAETPPRNLRDECGPETDRLKLERSGPNGLEGLKLVGSETDQPLVQIELTESIDDPHKFQSPVGDYYFADGCRYVVFELEEREEFWIADVQSQKVGRLAEGWNLWALVDGS